MLKAGAGRSHLRLIDNESDIGAVEGKREIACATALLLLLILRRAPMSLSLSIRRRWSGRRGLEHFYRTGLGRSWPGIAERLEHATLLEGRARSGRDAGGASRVRPGVLLVGMLPASTTRSRRRSDFSLRSAEIAAESGTVSGGRFGSDLGEYDVGARCDRRQVPFQSFPPDGGRYPAWPMLQPPPGIATRSLRSAGCHRRGFHAGPYGRSAGSCSGCSLAEPLPGFTGPATMR